MRDLPAFLSERLSRLLDASEREAVLGDLEELGTRGWSGLWEVAGLVGRRQLGLWRNWRPWAAAFGVAVPVSFMLMGDSVLISLECMSAAKPRITTFVTPSAALLIVLGLQVVLLAGWSWTCGFFVGSVSRRTTWFSILCFGAPCLFCLSRFRIESLSPLSLFLFVLPAVAGIWRGVRVPRIEPRTALALAAGVTFGAAVVEIWASPYRQNLCGWASVLILTWPSWFLVATARGTASPSKEGRPSGLGNLAT